jgi:hypothetical protein
MPNWCENDLTATGPEADVRAFVARLDEARDREEDCLNFEAFLPPEDEHWWNHTGWYLRCEVLEPWGSRGSEEVKYSLTFDTAWSPPLSVVLAWSAAFPDLEFRLTYFESGMAFNGRYVCIAGVEEDNVAGDYFGDRGG